MNVLTEKLTTFSLALLLSKAEVGKIELSKISRELVSSAASSRVRASFFSRGLEVNINRPIRLTQRCTQFRSLGLLREPNRSMFEIYLLFKFSTSQG